ncbi:hypothetical protein [Streptococcus oralis]|jgi:hypothetical protein|uniref:Uncharacterized protein n=1 Tax=Streptococcus oralis TaxID=1303 RepID=A0A6N3ARS8_STROR
MNNISWPNIFMSVIATVISTFLINFFLTPFRKKFFQLFKTTKIENIQIRNAVSGGVNSSDNSIIRDYFEVSTQFSTDKDLNINQIKLKNVEVIFDYYNAELNFQYGLNPDRQIFSIFAINNGNKSIEIDGFMLKYVKGWWFENRYEEISSEEIPYIKIKPREIKRIVMVKVAKEQILKHFDLVSENQALLLQLFDKNSKRLISYPAPFDKENKKFLTRPMGAAGVDSNNEKNVFNISEPYQKMYTLQTKNHISKENPILSFFISLDQTASLKFDLEIYQNNKLVKFKRKDQRTQYVHVFRPNYHLYALDPTGLHGNVYRLLDEKSIEVLEYEEVEQYYPNILYKGKCDEKDNS